MSTTLDEAVREMVLEEIRTRGGEKGIEGVVARLEAAVNHLETLLRSSPGRDSRPEVPVAQDLEATRSAMRPVTTRVLFVTPTLAGETTNFYLHDSHLFRCVHGAFREAYGTSVPNGADFLTYFRDRGCWLLHVPHAPRRGPGRPPKGIVSPSVNFLVDAIRDSRPEWIVSVREPIRTALETAMEIAGMPDDRRISVRIPRELLRPEFVVHLTREMLTPESPQRRTRAR